MVTQGCTTLTRLLCVTQVPFYVEVRGSARLHMQSYVYIAREGNRNVPFTDGHDGLRAKEGERAGALHCRPLFALTPPGCQGECVAKETLD